MLFLWYWGALSACSELCPSVEMEQGVLIIITFQTSHYSKYLNGFLMYFILLNAIFQYWYTSIL